MAAPFHPQQVMDAIATLFTDPNPQNKAAADAWLSSFCQSDAAWSISMQLMENAPPGEVRFFAANMLLTKARTSIASLPPEARASLDRSLLHMVFHRADMPQFLVSRVCLVIAAIVLRTNNGTFNTRKLLDDLISAANAAQADMAAREKVLSIIIGVLQAVAEECDRLDGMSMETAITSVRVSSCT